MKKIITFIMVVMALLLTSCGGVKKEKVEENGALKIGLVLSTGGLGDKSFNDSAYAGLIEAQKKLGVKIKYVEPANVSEFDTFLRQFAEANYDLIIGIGFQMRDSIVKVAEEYPEMYFLMVDEPIDMPNVISATFNEQEGSFVAGALAGMMTKSNVIGFIGGMEVPLIKRFGNGFMAGAKYIDPEITTFEAYVGGNSPFNDPARGKEMALSMIDSKADIVYHAAAGSGMGVFEAAKERGVYAVGVDSNQDAVVPGIVLTSMLKKVDRAVFTIIKEMKEKGFTAGQKDFNLANNGVGITDLKYTKDQISEDKLKKLDQIKADIISGKIDVIAEISKLK
ncbi:MAG: BMP family ABC transporter substrate-binding protein [Fusobacteriia bacterium 4572_74]|nr:MAG: BMP family ABC transporter substrate-binding protein [Fusobacteriia bacterium 4572_74]